ncbi:MAG: [FeFe] hydrogenase H-cluster radical SAM maturase HydG [Lentisphaerae bacterium]|nr:[FeFe] hydrogenase H-cluster radical SAM maturase HydG [Lentisphaerota bacterium]
MEVRAAPARFIDEAGIAATLAATGDADPVRVREILARARALKGLEADDVAVLMNVTHPALMAELFETARWVKETIYGNRLVLFAPLYISNLCGNECTYCAFRVGNTELTRRALTQEEIAREARALIDQGHKRLLVVAGEAYPAEGFDYVLRSIETIYQTRGARGEIRRVNVNVAPLSVADFRRLKAVGIGTYQIFQETYHRQTYARVHRCGPKRDYDWRITAPDRAMEAGIDDLGVGILFGLYHWKFEMLALLQHIRHLERTFGVGPHTISVPRMEPAVGSPLAAQPPQPVSDADFQKLVAILRLAVPYTGIIMSTRENAETRRATFALGVSQISAGSRCDPGGYTGGDGRQLEQFQLGDHRALDEVVRDLASLGYTPSFCTACYRLGRTGADFMDLAKPGLIKLHCAPNALSTCMEYLLDHASPPTRREGEAFVVRELASMEPAVREIALKLVTAVREGKRDALV